MFAAEKSLELDVINVDLPGREQRSDEFVANKNPSGKIPVLELDDGTCIAETVAIQRFLEAEAPEPNLFGDSPMETALIEMQHRFVELELLNQIGVSWINGPIVARSGLIKPIEAARKRSDAFVRSFYERLDNELGESEYIAVDRFTVADITAWISIEFASSLVGLPPDEALTNLAAWRERIRSRPSSGAGAL